MTAFDPIHATYGAILEVLVHHPGSTVEEICDYLKSEHSITVQKSNMYKKLTPLIEKQVAVRNGKKILLNMNWIAQASRFMEDACQQYRVPQGGQYSIPHTEGDEITLVYNSLNDLYPIWGHITQQIILQSNNKERFSYNKHPYFFLLNKINQEQGHVFLYNFPEKDFKLNLCIGTKTALGKVGVDYYNTIDGITCGFAKKNPCSKDVHMCTVCGSYIITIEWPESLDNQFDFFYQTIQDAKTFQEDLYKNIYNTHAQCTLRIRFDSAKAAELEKKMGAALT